MTDNWKMRHVRDMLGDPDWNGTVEPPWHGIDDPAARAAIDGARTAWATYLGLVPPGMMSTPCQNSMAGDVPAPSRPKPPKRKRRKKGKRHGRRR